MGDIKLVVESLTGDDTGKLDINASEMIFSTDVVNPTIKQDDTNLTATDITIQAQNNTSSNPGGNLNLISGTSALVGQNGNILLQVDTNNTIKIDQGDIILKSSNSTQITGNGTRLYLQCAVLYRVLTISNNYTVDTGGTGLLDVMLLINTLSSTVNITLSDPSNMQGRILIFKDIAGNAATNNITLVRYGSEKIEGVAASYVLNTNFAKLTLTTDGVDWYII